MVKRVTITAKEFKTRCLQLIDLVDSKRVEVEITKRGRPVARLLPVEKSTRLFGCLAGTVTYNSSVVAPVGATWEAEV